MTVSYSIDEAKGRTVSQNSKTSNFWSVFPAVLRLLQQPFILLRHLRRRRRFVALLNYDDHMIEDMGLTRAIIKEAAKLPLRLNAARIARAWSKQR